MKPLFIKQSKSDIAKINQINNLKLRVANIEIEKMLKKANDDRRTK